MDRPTPLDSKGVRGMDAKVIADIRKSEIEQMRERIQELEQEVERLRKERNEAEEARDNLCQDEFLMIQQLQEALVKIRFLLADKAERIPMTNFGRDIDKIAEQALKIRE